MRAPHPQWLDDSGPHRGRLVDALLAAGAIRTEAVRAAFSVTPRELFVARHALRHGVPAVYANEVLVTLTGPDGAAFSSSSQPQLMAAMLECLRVEPGMRVLEVGTGTGYNAALLSHLAGPRGHVVSVEVDPGVAQAARTALATGGYGVEVITGDGALGAPGRGAFDRVIVTASTATVPLAWREQLVDGGRLEVPLRLNHDETQAVATFRQEAGRLVSDQVLSGRFMALRPDGQRVAAPTDPFVIAAPSGDSDAVRLAGASVSSLDPAGRDRLLASLQVPRVRSLGITAPPWDLVMFVSLEVPSGRLVSRWPELSVGVLAGDGGIAMVEGRRVDGHVPRPLSVVAHGPPAATAELATVIDRWVALGLPGVRDLVLTVEDAVEGGEVTHRWRGDNTRPTGRTTRSGY